MTCAFHPCECDDESCRSTLIGALSFLASCCRRAVHGVARGLLGNSGAAGAAGGCCHSVALHLTGRELDSGPEASLCGLCVCLCGVSTGPVSVY